ncbi:electron transfer flavoprotein subunit alpha [Neokomagataea thailandica NBRC 106555]|uniref:Electron transfer flavoprotein subunit alpha n=2 Tax=Neokomagataea TaxID=1223423 RepID=A0A4Y6V7P0_9PROT|nr:MULTISPECIES: FAD-binding protein [Neokomagataea]QDH24556.1 electron transfer flavoprotein subunit alpha/FixB family protein [Neokomagataea tanensis]GBR51324.1 electron transfer flavoprotein subunit alpha [Neokomagataea thailandica NBRC 106555]
MTALVLVEYENNDIRQSSRSAIAAAAQLGEVDVLLLGASAEAAARFPSVRKVLHLPCDGALKGLAEPVAALIAALSADYTHIIGAASASTKNILPRAAALIDVQPIPDVVSILDQETFIRPIYAGNALATVRSTDKHKVLTIRPAHFDPVGTEGGAAEIVVLSNDLTSPLSDIVSVQLSQSDRPELDAARVVVSGGRGMQNAENFKLLESLADKLGAAVGASRAAVDAGFVPNELQVGQTGKIVAPELYIAVGISGAIQHLAGMKDSKVIVAINKDPEAPIFQSADYGIVGDLFEILPKLQAGLG